MKELNKLMTWIFFSIILLRILDLFVFQIPIEIMNESLSLLVEISFPFSIAGLSAIYLVKQINRNKSSKYVWIALFSLTILVSLLSSFIIVFTNSLNYRDSQIIWQSLENENDKIVIQIMDKGALGLEKREVRIGNQFLGMRFANQFKKTRLNGKWVHYNENKLDTMTLENVSYKSEINTMNIN